MTRPLAEATYGVAQLCAEVRDLLAEAYFSVWVAGEVQRLRPNRRGHLYFELVEKGSGDEIVGKLEAVCWRRDYQRVQRALRRTDQRLDEGQEIRCRANLDFYPPFGRLQLVVREVDPVFSLGQLERRRRQTLAWLAEAGLLERNRALRLPHLPLRIALVTAAGSAAYHDFLSTLQESSYGFRVSLLDAAVQGRQAERELTRALGRLGRLPVDCAALVRGGGSRTDLAAFDSRAVAEAVARAPVPLLAGLGHQIDETIADRVAHTALKTPTKVAEFLVERIRAADDRVAAAHLRLRREALEPLSAARRRLERTGRELRAAGHRLAAFETRLTAVGGRLGRAGLELLRRARERALGLGARAGWAAPRAVRDAGRERRRVGERLAAAARLRLREAGARLEGRRRLCRELSPQRTLARGFTITRSAAGVALKSAASVRPGEKIETVWADGSRSSRVEEP